MPNEIPDLRSVPTVSIAELKAMIDALTPPRRVLIVHTTRVAAVEAELAKAAERQPDLIARLAIERIEVHGNEWCPESNAYMMAHPEEYLKSRLTDLSL